MPANSAYEGDERIRTAVPDGTNDPVYGGQPREYLGHPRNVYGTNDVVTSRPAVPNTEPAKRMPQPGDTWRSRDPRDNGLTVAVLDVWADSSHKWVRIQRFRKTNVSLRRFHRDYEFVSGGAA